MKDLNKISSLIDYDNSLNSIQKTLLKNKVNNAFDLVNAENELADKILSKFSHKRRASISDLLKLNDNYAIFVEQDSTHHITLYRTYDIKTDSLLAECSCTLYEQLLITLGFHCLGINQQFAEFACKMLELNKS
jgi:hypothetical protein